MAYRHGIYTNESPTALLPPVSVDGGLIFAIGTAPIHLASEPAEPNKPVLCYEIDEAVKNFGYNADFDNYTLNEVISSQFVLFGVSPIVLVNVLDPAKHFHVKTLKAGGIISTPAEIDAAVDLSTLKVTAEGETTLQDLTENSEYTATVNTQTDPADNYTTIDIIIDAQLPSDKIKISYTTSAGDSVSVDKNVDELPFDLPVGATSVSLQAVITPIKELVKDIDYTAAYDSDGKVIVTLLDDSDVPNDEVTFTFNEIDPSMVTKEDIIGGIDLVTNKRKGLELIEEVFPRFRLVPGTIIAPKFSTDVTVAAVMKAKTTGINGVFRAIALVDIPTDEVINYTAAAEWKNEKNIVDTSVVACYPKVSLGGMQYHLSTQLASLMNKVDSEHNDVPYKSPSNEGIQCDQTVLSDGTEMIMTKEMANYLNGNGIVTALNFANGWTAWGSRTSIYPSSTDTKDSFLPIRRVFNWIQNTLILTYFSKVDQPIRRRLLDSITDSVGTWFNGLQKMEYIIGGRIEFREADNPTTSLIDGIIQFKIYLTPPPPAREIAFDVEFDPDYFSTLFD